MTRAKVKHLIAGNKLLQRVHLEADRHMYIHKIKEPMIIGWVDASHHSTRPDGRSTEGIFICLTETAMIHGDECFVIPLVWESCKIRQMCQSPSAAEAKALCDIEEEINAVRYHMADMLGLDSPGDNKEEICAKIPAVLATDSKNMVEFFNSKEEITGVDLAKFRKSCAKTDLKIKWVNGDSQLAASLTKNYEQAQMDWFYKLGGRWRLNSDETYTSMRKYRQLRITALEDAQPRPEVLPDEDASEVLPDEESESSEDSTI